LKKGGNAIDATVATALSLAVTHPEAGNIGGGGFIVFMKSDGEATTFDFREKAPSAASPTMFLDENGKIRDNSNHKGLLFCGVPGTVAGLYQAHQKYGKLPWAETGATCNRSGEKWFSHVMGPSINVAVQRSKMDASYDINAKFLRGANGEVVAPGELWKQPALAKTLEAIRDQGRDGFYKGAVSR